MNFYDEGLNRKKTKNNSSREENLNYDNVFPKKISGTTSQNRISQDDVDIGVVTFNKLRPTIFF